MLVFASVISSLATLSLTSSVGSREGRCPPNGVLDAKNFTLLAVDKTNTSYQGPLALTVDGTLNPTPLTDDEYFSMEGGGITAYGPNGGVVAISATFDSGNSPVPFIVTDNPLLLRPADV
ncbi:hypothetical protein BJV74DRAFT_888725 [Russula compacta]|nr:hypothetical protein BJV74DRAFT_888725 [Russula compacta]